MGTNVGKILRENDNKKKRKGEEKKPRKWEAKTGIIANASLVLFTLYFILLAWYFLYVSNADTMYFLQDSSILQYNLNMRRLLQKNIFRQDNQVTGFSFQTADFSDFVLKYTVTFHFNDK